MSKILLVANVSKEHIRKFYIPFIKQMQEGGWMVDVACRMDVPVPEADNAYDLPCDRNPFRGGIGKSVKRLKRILQGNDYDILVCSTVVGSIIARLAAAPFRKHGLKVIYLCHGLHFFPGAPTLRWAMGYPVEKLLAAKTDMMITINETDCHTAKKYLKSPVIEKCHGMGVDLDRFHDTALSGSEREEKRKGLGIGPDDFVMIYVAEIIDNKNQRMLIEAFETVQKTIPNAKLLLVGPEHDGGKLRGFVASKGLQKDVLLLGWRSDVPVLLHLADVYVASSKSEGLGLNVIEAMACDLPVVVTRNRGHEEMAVHGNTGFLVDVNDSEAMADYVIQLHNNEEIRNAMIAQARQNIEKFATEAAIEELAEMIVCHA